MDFSKDKWNNSFSIQSAFKDLVAAQGKTITGQELTNVAARQLGQNIQKSVEPSVTSFVKSAPNIMQKTMDVAALPITLVEKGIEKIQPKALTESKYGRVLPMVGGIVASFVDPLGGESKLAKISKELLPLIEEAKKYNSADEFVKAQGKPLLHGGPETIGEFKYAGKRGVGGVYLTPDTNMAKTFSGKEGKITEAFVKPKKIFKIQKGSDQYAGSGGMGDDILVEAPHNYPDEIKRLKSEGFDAIQSSDGKQLLVLDPSQIKTKSQLTDIWNKAHSK